MLHAQLVRTQRSADGTFGILRVGELQLFTMEDDWKNNQRSESCIPVGTYRCRRSMFYKHGLETFEITGVPDRSRILFHPANTEEDVEGCIGLGMALGKVRVRRDEDTGESDVTKQAVTSSRIAFDRFMRELMGVDDFTLTIEWAIDVAPAT